MSIAALFGAVPTGTGPTGSIDTLNTGASVPSKTFRYAAGLAGDLTTIWASDDDINYQFIGSLVGPSGDLTLDISARYFLCIREAVADPTAPAPVISLALESPSGGSASGGTIFALSGTQEVSTTPENLDDSKGGAEVKTTVGAIVLRLPSLSSVANGSAYFVKKITSDANPVNVTPDATDKIDGANAVYALAGFNECAVFRANTLGGTGFSPQWDVVAQANNQVDSLDVKATPPAGAGRVPVEFAINVTGPGNFDQVITEALDVHTVVVQKVNGAGAAGDTIQVTNLGVGAITEAMAVDVAVSALVRNQVCSVTNFAVAAGGTLRAIGVQAGADCQGRVIIQGWKR